MTHLDDAALDAIEQRADAAITTVEQLAALPVGTVLRDAWDSCVEMTPGRPLRRYTLPATVLYRPDLPSQDALLAAVREARAATTHEVEDEPEAVHLHIGHHVYVPGLNADSEGGRVHAIHHEPDRITIELLRQEPFDPAEQEIAAIEAAVDDATPDGVHIGTPFARALHARGVRVIGEGSQS